MFFSHFTDFFFLTLLQIKQHFDLDVAIIIYCNVVHRAVLNSSNIFS